MSDPDATPDASSPTEVARRRVADILGDFDAGRITRPDAERVRDRAARAVRDIDGYRGFRRVGP